MRWWGSSLEEMPGVGAPVSVTVVSPAPRDAWQEICDADSTATLSQTPAWTDALVGWTGWKDASRHYRTDDGRSFVLPLVKRGPAGRGAIYASLPSGWGVGGFVGAHTLRTEDAAAALSDIQRPNPLAARFLPNPLQGEIWSCPPTSAAIVLPRYSHVVDLEGGFDKVWSERYRRTARRTIGKASDDLDIERDTSGRLIPVYRELFRRSVERWAQRSREPRWLARIRESREDPTGKLEYLAESLGDQMVTWVAWYRGEPAAADIILRGSSHFGWRGAMHEELGPATHAAYLLQNLSIKEACEAGARYYYLGESGESAGLALFKERFGGIGHRYSEIRVERLPYTRVNQLAATTVKRLVGYQKH